MKGTTEIENDQPEQKILLVDDDRKFCRLVQEYLYPMGFVVEIAHTGAEGLQKALSGRYNAVILDIMMPGMDGFEVLQKLRRTSNVPVLMLTALGEETDRIVGLEMGADDYVPKTFSIRELLARLRAVIRRQLKSEHSNARPKTEDILIVGDLKINVLSRSAWMGDEVLGLTSIEFDILVLLAKSVGCVLTRDQLLNAVAGRSYEAFDRSVDVHISSLRKKIGDDPREPSYIKTIRNVGYMLSSVEEPL